MNRMGYLVPIYLSELSGVEDVAGNVVEAFNGTRSIADPANDAVLAIGPRAGDVLAILDGPDGVAIVSNVPIDAASSTGAVTVKKQGEPLAGTSELLGETTLLWKPENTAAWIEGANYEITFSAALVDISGRSVLAPASSLSFIHLAQGDAIWTRPTEAPLRQQSAYSNGRFLHGRPYLADLGLSDHRARFYDPETQTFLSPDPLGPVDSTNLQGGFAADPHSVTDPGGAYAIDFHYYVVYLMAYLATGDSHKSARIAWASQYVDEHPETEPIKSGGAERFIFHFPELTGMPTRMGSRNRLVGAVLSRSVSEGNDFAVGVALHMLADSFGHAGFSWRTGAPVNYQYAWPLWSYVGAPLAKGHLLAHISDFDVDDPSEAPGRAAQAALSVFDAVSRIPGTTGLIGHKYFLSRRHLQDWLVLAFSSIAGDKEQRAIRWRRQIEAMGISTVPLERVPQPRDYGEFDRALADVRKVIRDFDTAVSVSPSR